MFPATNPPPIEPEDRRLIVVLVFGTICVDRMVRVPEMPAPGHYVEAMSETVLLGGEAANTAARLKDLGCPVSLAGNDLGSGPAGSWLRTEIARRHLPLLEGHATAKESTPHCDIFVDDDAERTMIGQGFSAMEKGVNPELLSFRPGEWFTADPNMPSAGAEALRLAQRSGMRVYAMDFVAESDPIFPGWFWQSSTRWLGKRGELGVVRAAAQKRHEETGATVILTDGPRGLVSAAPGMPARLFPAFQPSTFVDSTGAGDAFRAGMLYGLTQDWELLRCLRFAAACGCLSCQVLGGSSGVIGVSDVEKLIDSQPRVSDAYA